MCSAIIPSVRATRWVFALAVGVPALALGLLVGRWAWTEATGFCGLLDEQGFACEPAFTAEDAREGKVQFELVRDPEAERWVRFAMLNTTTAERSVTWHDAELRTLDNRRLRCFWGDDSYPRYPAMPGKRTITERQCEAPSDRLELYYRNVKVAEG